MSQASATASTVSVEQVQARAEAFRRDYAAVQAEVAKAVVGHGEIVEGVITAMFCSGHVLLEGVPGIGKTLLIRTLSRALHLGFSRIQFTPDLMPADITGTTVVVEQDRPDGGRARQFVFQRGPIFAQMVLADEINRATPKTQAAMLEAMAEQSVTVGGVSHRLEKPFFVMATQNPLEQEGTYPLPEAQLDRFLFKLIVGASSRAELSSILDRTTAGYEPRIEPVLDAAKIVEHQQLVRAVPIAKHVQDYAVRLTLGTHPKATGGGVYSTPMVERFVKVGASPRAAQALVLAAKCRALIDGRTSVSVADIKRLAIAALRHRLILNFEAQAEGVTTDAVVDNLIGTLPQAADDQLN